MWTDFRLQYDGDGRLCVPITDASFDIDTANKFANSCQVREKGLKILQYVLRLGAYTDVVPAASKALKGLSKTTSIARRFFKFCRWVKHFEDLAEAKDEKDFVMRVQLFIRVAANFGAGARAAALPRRGPFARETARTDTATRSLDLSAPPPHARLRRALVTPRCADWAEDVCSLERIGILPKGTLSVEFMLFAEYCQLVLALVEVSVTSAKLRKEEEKTAKVSAPHTARTRPAHPHTANCRAHHAHNRADRMPRGARHEHTRTRAHLLQTAPASVRHPACTARLCSPTPRPRARHLPL
eukprot:7363622-Prymnesium_polylepis.1